MILHLKDGNIMPLNKNRRIEENEIIHFSSLGNESNVCIDDILKIEMFTT